MHLVMRFALKYAAAKLDRSKYAAKNAALVADNLNIQGTIDICDSLCQRVL